MNINKNIKELYTKKYFFITIISVGLVLSVVLPQSNVFTKKHPAVVSVDIRDILNTFISNTQKKNLNSEQVNHDVEEFSNKLSQYIKDKAEQENIIIVTKQAVLAGAKDYTPKIKQELFRESR
ncbi:MAG: TrbI F-type domain-containing protein [Rickettsiaceae bacterium]|nr:TrbI F-type domain-containing protein [Rickettsiaceae bacterium]